jgi:hypothetical protein
MRTEVKDVGSASLLVRRNAADSSILVHGCAYSHVFVDVSDRSDYSHADLPVLAGPCVRLISVLALLDTMRGHAHEASVDHPDPRPFLGQTATPHTSLTGVLAHLSQLQICRAYP